MVVTARKDKRSTDWKTVVLLALTAQVQKDHLGLVVCRLLWSSLGHRFQGTSGAGALQVVLELSDSSAVWKSAGTD